MADEQGTPNAHGAQDEAERVTPPANGQTTAASAGPDEKVKKLESTLTRQGRELAEARQREQALAAQIAQQQQTLQQLQAHVSASEQRRMQAELDAITDPYERLQKELEIVKGQVNRAQQPPVVQPPVVRPTPQEPTQDEIRQMGQRILADVGKRLGVEIDPDSADLDWNGPQALRESALILAGSMKQRPQQQQPVQSGTVEEPVAKQSAETVDDRAARDLGLNGSFSPRPKTPPKSGPVSSDDFNRVLGKYNPRTPRAVREELKQLRDRAERAAGAAAS